MRLVWNADTNRKIDDAGAWVWDVVMRSSGSGYNNVDVIFVFCPRRILTFGIGAEGGKRR